MEGIIKAVCTSPAKGTAKANVGQAVCVEDWGLEGDAHAGKWHRQVSLLSYEKIEELHGKLSEKEIYDVIWKNVKEVNKKLTSYKAIKSLEIKEGEFEKTSTMKIKRYKELNK